MVRIELALLRNKFDNTPVIPVWVGEVKSDGEGFEKWSLARLSNEFPAEKHARSESTEEIISLLRFFLHYFILKF